MPVGDSTSQPVQGTGDAPATDPVNPAQSGTEGSGTTEGDAPETTTPQEGTGEGEAPEETSGEQTLQYDFDASQTDSSTTTTTTDTQDVTQTTEDKQTWDTFEQLMKKAEAGDAKAIKRLDEMNQQQLQEADDLAQQLEPKDKYSSKEEADAQKKIYEKALSKQVLLDSMAKKYEAKEKACLKAGDKDGAKAWKEKAHNAKQRSSKLRQQTKAFEARQQEAKTADKKKGLDQVVKNKKPEAPVKADKNAKTAGRMKQGQGGLYGKDGAKTTATPQKTTPKAGDEAAKKTADGKKAEGEKPKEAAKTKETPETAKPDLGDSDAEVAAAQRAVEANEPKELRRERLRIAKEKQEKIEALKLAFGEATADLKAMGGEGAMQKSAELYACVKAAGLKYRDGYSQGFDDLVGGKSTVGGLVHFDGKMGEAVSTMETGLGEAVEGSETAMAKLNSSFTGTREEVDQGMAALKQEKQEFTSDFKPGRIYGYFAHWVPASERPHTVGADLKRDNIKHSVV